MKFSLLPRENAFFHLLEKLSAKVEESALSFQELVFSWNPNHPNIQKLRDLEHECDAIVAEIMGKLNQTFITPIDREDILSLGKKTDDLIDIIQSLSERLLLFHIETIKDEFKEMTHLLTDSAKLVSRAMHRIKNKKEMSQLLDDCFAINTIENQADRIYEKALGALFLHPSDPIEVIKWKELFDSLEMSIDTAEHISAIIWGIGIKYG